MLGLLETTFFICISLLIYHYFVYPTMIITLARFFRKPSVAQFSTDSEVPSVTIVIAAFNEERVIASKLENTLALDYPNGGMKIIVAAHGSTDATGDIAMSYGPRGVSVLCDSVRRGKTAALNRALESATSDVIVFSDANNYFNPDALRQLVKHFADPAVGGVCGLKQIYESVDRESAKGDSLYWRYESAIKIAESHLGSITTADGEIFAIRRDLYRPLDEKLINDDAAITFDLVKSKYRVLYEPAARSYELASIRIEDDFAVKVRMVSGGFQTLRQNWRFLMPPVHYFAWTFFSHKTLRWLAPELLILLFLSTLSLIDKPFFQVMLLLQLIFYALAVFGWKTRARASQPLAVYVPFYFCAMNTAALFGLYRHLSQTTQWKKAER